MKKENYTKIDAKGVEWYRIAGLSKKLGVTDQTIRNWIDEGVVVREEDEEGRPWVRLADGVVKGGGRHGLCKYGFARED